jgi:hypothetical protein
MLRHLTVMGQILVTQTIKYNLERQISQRGKVSHSEIRSLNTEVSTCLPE